MRNVDDQMRLGRNVKTMLRKRGMTQKKLAITMGASEAFVSLVVNGRRDMGMRMFMRMCDALQCSPNDLLEGIGAE